MLLPNNFNCVKSQFIDLFHVLKKSSWQELSQLAIVATAIFKVDF